MHGAGKFEIAKKYIYFLMMLTNVHFKLSSQNNKSGSLIANGMMCLIFSMI
jgi:hypothetical protein